MAAKNDAIRIYYIKEKIDYCKFESLGDRDEKINDIITKCSKLAETEYKTRHDWVGKVINW